MLTLPKLQLMPSLISSGIGFNKKFAIAFPFQVVLKSPACRFRRVGAKHSSDNARCPTKIFLSECFALTNRNQGEAFGNRDLGVPDRSSSKCFAPTSSRQIFEVLYASPSIFGNSTH